MYIFIVAAIVFALCFVLDKLFGKVFRGKAQHQSGLSVRLAKRYGVAGLLVSVLAVLVLMQLVKEYNTLLLLAGIILAVTGIGLIVYYLSFGVYYDDESFLLSVFGRPSVTYRYADITAQQLYRTAGGIMVELYLSDGRTVGLQQGMEGLYPFLDKACHARFRQLGINSFECEWFDEDNSCWFPPKED